MGTPVACAYATLTFGHYENTTLLPAFRDNLLFYRRYIDDIFGIWIPSRNNNHTWRCFKEQLGNWGKLTWSIKEPSKQVNFLDLIINLDKSTISFSTYQKPLNLYLYIPPLSAHPNSCLKGLIKGELQRYWTQNNHQTFQQLTTKFIERLHARGHTIKSLTPTLLQAADSLTYQTKLNNKNKNKSNDNDNNLYFHWKYHPKGLQWQDIRQTFNANLRQHIPFERMVIAMSRPRNLRDILTRTALKLPEDFNLNKFIEETKLQTSQSVRSHVNYFHTNH
jgi:hypothetical protein